MKCAVCGADGYGQRDAVICFGTGTVCQKTGFSCGGNGMFNRIEKQTKILENTFFILPPRCLFHVFLLNFVFAGRYCLHKRRCCQKGIDVFLGLCDIEASVGNRPYRPAAHIEIFNTQKSACVTFCQMRTENGITFF